MNLAISKTVPLVFHVFIAVAIMVYLVAIMVCGRHGIGLYRVGQKKPDCFSELITLRQLVVEMRVICQNLANFI